MLVVGCTTEPRCGELPTACLWLAISEDGDGPLETERLPLRFRIDEVGLERGTDVGIVLDIDEAADTGTDPGITLWETDSLIKAGPEEEPRCLEFEDL